MPFLKQNLNPFILTLALLALPLIQSAEASSSFESYGTVTYTLNTISNQNNPGSFTGLLIEGIFNLDSDQIFNNHSGDGSVTVSPDKLSSSPISALTGNSFSKTFQVNGNVNDGSVLTNYLSQIDLQFENNSSNIFDIEVLMSYSLSASISGENGNSIVSIEYYSLDTDDTEDENFFGFESIEANASPLDLSNVNLNGTDSLTFSLNPGDFRGFFSEVTIDGALEASPVPLPSAIWFLSSALVTLLRIRKS